MNFLRPSAADGSRRNVSETTRRVSASYNREAQDEQIRRKELASGVHTIIRNRTDSDTNTLQAFLNNNSAAASARDQEHHGGTPLHAAAELGRTELLDLLVSRKDVDIDAVNLKKQTPLHLAVINGSKECVELLLRAGANAQKVDDKGHLARYYVRKGEEGRRLKELFDSPPRVVKRGGGEIGKGKKSGTRVELQSSTSSEAESGEGEETDDGGTVKIQSVPVTEEIHVGAVGKAAGIASVSSVPEAGIFGAASVGKAQARTYDDPEEKEREMERRLTRREMEEWRHNEGMRILRERKRAEERKEAKVRKSAAERDPVLPATPPQGMQKTLCEEFRGSFWEPGGDSQWTLASVWDLVYDDSPRKRGPSKKMWFHLPATREEWATDLARNICAAGKMCTGERSIEVCDFIARVFKSVDNEGPVRKNHFIREASSNKRDIDRNEMYAVVLPIIDVDKQDYVRLAREHHSLVLEQARTENLLPLNSLYKYRDSDDPVVGSHLKTMMQLSTFFEHPPPRSLDQSYHEYLDDHRVQRLDGDQVLTRYIDRIKTKSSELAHRLTGETSTDLGSANNQEAKFHDIITVPHFWLFRLDADTIITLYPERWDNRNESRLHHHILQCVSNNHDTNDDDTDDRHGPPFGSQNSIDRVAATILDSCLSFEAKAFAKCTSPQDPRDFHDVEVTFSKAYANSISEMYMELSERFEELKNGLGFLTKDPNDFYRGVKEETMILIGTDDNIAEINMIKRILRNQVKTVNMFRNVAPGLRFYDGTEENSPTLEVFEQLEREAERVRAMAITILDLRQQEAAIEDILNQGEQNTMLFIFTTITVLFSPLSLVCGILAMPVAGFPEAWDASPLAKVFGLATLATAGLCLLMWALYKIYQTFELRQRRKERSQERRLLLAGNKAKQQPESWMASGFQRPGAGFGLGMRFRGSRRRGDGDDTVLDGRAAGSMGQRGGDVEKGV